MRNPPLRARPSLLRSLRLAGVLGLALTLPLIATGCETLEKFNPFEEKEKKLPGDRHAVFPEGVPGVDYSHGLGQPSNANAPIDLPNPPAGGGAAPAR